MRIISTLMKPVYAGVHGLGVAAKFSGRCMHATMDLFGATVATSGATVTSPKKFYSHSVTVYSTDSKIKKPFYVFAGMCVHFKDATASMYRTIHAQKVV